MSISRVIGTISADPGLPQLDYHDLVAQGVHIPEFIETGLDGDWSFDLPDPETFRSRINSEVLNTEGKDYSLRDNVAGKYLQIHSGGLNGLPGPTVDALEMTYAGLFNYREPVVGADVQVLMGSSRNIAANGGEYVGIVDDGRIILNVRGYSSNIEVSASELGDAGIEYDNQHFLFIAATSRITSGSDTEHTLFVGAPTPIVKSDTGTKILSTNEHTIALGNAWNPSSGYDEMDIRCGRFFSASRPSTVAELNAIYQRAKVIAARRGMTVK